MADPATAVRLLMVEDDEGVSEMYRLQLTAKGYDVTTATTGEEALRLAADLSPQLIYLDLGLPQMGGLEVLERLRAAEATRHVPVIILTNFSDQELVDRGMALGAQEYLIKAHTTPARLTEMTRRWAPVVAG